MYESWKESWYEFFARCYIPVLCGEAGVAEVSGFAVVEVEAAVVEIAMLGVDDERDDVVAQAFAEEDEAADAEVGQVGV